jgi:hypothetical protein
MGDRSGEADNLHGLAAIDRSEGKREAARAGFEKALEIWEQTGNKQRRAAALNSLARLDRD